VRLAIASDSVIVAEYIISKIDKPVTTSSKGIGIKYNGIDILQTCDYIKLYCKSYIDKVLLLHGWSKLSPSISKHHDIVPLSPDTVSHLQDLIGPSEHTKEHSEIKKRAKFSYCGLLGELLYSFIVIHVKIGYAIQFLSKFSSSPHLDHYMALKSICKYLQKHKSQGLPKQSIFSLKFHLKSYMLTHNYHLFKNLIQLLPMLCMRLIVRLTAL